MISGKCNKCGRKYYDYAINGGYNTCEHCGGTIERNEDTETEETEENE